MTIRNGDWGSYEVLDEDGSVVAVVDTPGEATEIYSELQEHEASEDGSGDPLLGLF
jgi:hypothetical protein